MGGITPRECRWEGLARKARKCGYLDAPVPKEKPPPVPVPPAATVVEPSAPVPKENPVDMAAPAQRVQDAERGLGCSSRIKAEAGREALLPASARTRREPPTPAAAKPGRGGRNHRAGGRPSAACARTAHRKRARRAGNSGRGGVGVPRKAPWAWGWVPAYSLEVDAPSSNKTTLFPF